MKTIIVLTTLAFGTLSATSAFAASSMAPSGNAMMSAPATGGMMAPHKPKPKKPSKPMTNAMHPANSMAPQAGGMMTPAGNTMAPATNGMAPANHMGSSH